MVSGGNLVMFWVCFLSAQQLSVPDLLANVITCWITGLGLTVYFPQTLAVTYFFVVSGTCCSMDCEIQRTSSL